MSIWDDDESNAFKGTYGSVSVPFKTRDQTYYTFIPDLCRHASIFESNFNSNIILNYLLPYGSLKGRWI